MSNKPAEKAEQPKKPEAAESEAPAKKKLPVKLAGLVGGVMVLEGVLVFGVVSMLGKAPEAADAAELEGHGHADDEALVELPLVDDNFQNMQTGKAWIWKMSVYLKVMKKHEAHVTDQIAAREAEIKEKVGQLVRRAQHSQLKEPELRTLNRQLTALVADLFGEDQVDRVLITRCEGFAIDP